MFLIKCKDIVFELIREKELSSESLIRNTDKSNSLGLICDAIDSFRNEFGICEYSVFIDECNNVHIDAEYADEIVVRDPEHIFYLTVFAAKEFAFSVSNTGDLIASYVFPGIWD